MIKFEVGFENKFGYEFLGIYYGETDKDVYDQIKMNLYKYREIYKSEIDEKFTLNMTDILIREIR